MSYNAEFCTALTIFIENLFDKSTFYESTYVFDCDSMTGENRQLVTN